jgi:predicted transcriptional regulator
MHVENSLVMLMPKRTDLEIIAEILANCKQPRPKTHVMYMTNLSWQMVSKYLARLQILGFLGVHHSKTKYATTEKGLEFLNRWNSLIELL